MVLGVVLVLASVSLLILWHHAESTHQPLMNEGFCNLNYDINNPPTAADCGFIPANPVPSSEYAYSALVTGTVGVGCLIGTYMLGRRLKA